MMFLIRTAEQVAEVGGRLSSLPEPLRRSFHAKALELLGSQGPLVVLLGSGRVLFTPLKPRPGGERVVFLGV